MLYKLLNGELINTEETKIVYENNIPKRVNKTEEELDGWRVLNIVREAFPNIYENETITFTDDGSTIYETHNVEPKSQEEIIAINEKFWNENYKKVTTMPLKNVYIPIVSYINGREHDIYGSNYAILLMESFTGQLNSYTLYNNPDMTQMFTADYIKTLETTIEGTADITLLMTFLGTIAGSGSGNKEVPSIL